MSVQPDPDSSALLSTMAGAGATLVAIVGGLLVSRFVSLDSEQQGARRRLEEVSNRLAEATQERDELRHDLDRENVEEVLRDPDVLEQLVKEQAQRLSHMRKGESPAAEMTVQEFVDTLDDVEALVDDVVAIVLEEKRQAIRDALQFLQPVMRDQVEAVASKSQLLSWSDVRRVHELRPEREGTWEYVWDEWLIPRAHRRLDQRRRVGMDPYDLASLVVSPMPPTPTFYGEDSLGFEARLFRAQGKVDDLRAERRYAQSTLDAIGKPQGLRAGLLVLALLTATQVIPPVLFLAPSPAWLTFGQAVVLVSLFVSGLVALFWYLIHYALRLGLAHGREAAAAASTTSGDIPNGDPT